MEQGGLHEVFPVQGSCFSTQALAHCEQRFGVFPFEGSGW